MDAYARWAATVGEPDVALNLRRSQDGCRALQRQVKVTYRVWWSWHGTGRTWWIELTYRNRLARTLTATLFGDVRVTGLVGQKVWTPHGERRSGVLQWGASSADYGPIRPGESGQLVLLGDDPYVSTTADGTFRVEDVGVSTNIPGIRAAWCSLPVPESS